MDPLTTILAALALGLNEAGKHVIKDAYEGLKGPIKKRFADKNVTEGDAVLKRHEENPDTYKEHLKELLLEAEVAENPDILEAA